METLTASQVQSLVDGEHDEQNIWSLGGVKEMRERRGIVDRSFADTRMQEVEVQAAAGASAELGLVDELGSVVSKCKIRTW